MFFMNKVFNNSLSNNYFKPLTPVTDINDEIVTALMCSRNSDCPTMLIGDFNYCRLDCGEGDTTCVTCYTVRDAYALTTRTT